MSAYEKPQEDMLQFHTTSPLHDPSAFGAFAQPPFGPHLIFPPALVGSGPEADHLHFVNSPDYRPQPAFEEPRDARSRHAPQITSFTPAEGAEGSTVSVYLQTLHDYLAPPPLSISLSFASKRVECIIQLLSDPSEPVKQYAISAQVPPFITTGFHSFSVPLRLVMDSGHSSSASQALEVGTFKYSGLVAQSSQSRKRKASISSDEISQPLPKKVPTQRLKLEDRSAESYGYGQCASSPYSPFLPTPTGPYQASGHQTASPRPSGHHYSTSVASQTSITAPSPHTPVWSPSFTTVNKATHSPAPPSDSCCSSFGYRITSQSR